MSEINVQIKLVATAELQLKAGQEIDATINAPEQGIGTSNSQKIR